MILANHNTQQTMSTHRLYFWIQVTWHIVLYLLKVKVKASDGKIRVILELKDFLRVLQSSRRQRQMAWSSCWHTYAPYRNGSVVMMWWPHSQRERETTLPTFTVYYAVAFKATYIRTQQLSLPSADPPYMLAPISPCTSGTATLAGARCSRPACSRSQTRRYRCTWETPHYWQTQLGCL